MGLGDSVKHLVSISGGMQSAICADRVIERYGADAVTLWFADTLVEDADLYRFLGDLERRWGLRIVHHAEGETPLEVAERKRLIPNQRRAPCTNALKIEPFMRFLKRIAKPVTVYLGMGWWEQHRMERPRERYQAVPGVTVDYPSLWEPVDRREPSGIVRSWGIAPPRAYALGFSHNNCGGACVKQGRREWVRLLAWKPDLFARYEEWEAAQRAKGGARAGYAINQDRSGHTRRPQTLTEIRELVERGVLTPPPPGPADDAEGCLQCSI